MKLFPKLYDALKRYEKQKVERCQAIIGFAGNAQVIDTVFQCEALSHELVAMAFLEDVKSINNLPLALASDIGMLERIDLQFNLDEDDDEACNE